MKGYEDHPIIDIKEHRAKLLEISELMLHPDPEAEIETKSESDPLTNAVNSIRGEGFQALVWFIHREAETFPEAMPLGSLQMLNCCMNVHSPQNRRCR